MWKDGLLSEKEAKELCAFAFIAGHDTTTILIANAFRMAAEQPHHLARLRQNLADADRFVEEVARYRGTVQRVSRITTAPTTVSGVDLPEGAVVRLLLSAANRDSRKFAEERPSTSTAIQVATWALATACTNALARLWPSWKR
jgi:cytochrome P450